MIKFNSQPVPLLSQQQGAALILLFMAILMTGIVVFVTSISLNRSRIQSEAQTMQSLAKAKEALIAYAASYYERQNLGRYGFLPCPEQSYSGRDGQEGGNCPSQYENSIGRFPWQTLRIEPLKDSSGECLWYVVSSSFKQGSTVPSEMLNEDSPGMLRLFDENLNLLYGNNSENRVAAVIIAPGKPLAGQNRPSILQNSPPNIATECNIQPSIANPAISEYLENYNGINNSDVDDINTDRIDDFITTTGSGLAGLNDRIVVVTASEIFNAIRRQTSYQQRIEVLTEALAVCIAEYSKLNTAGTSPDYRMPWPASLNLNGSDYRVGTNYIESAGLNFGRFPFDVSGTHGLRINSGVSILLNNTQCQNISVVNRGQTFNVNLQNLNGEYRLLWQHWKDHLFYALSTDFEPRATTLTPTPNPPTNPLTVNGVTGYAGIVFFSGQRLVVPGVLDQRRLASQTEQPPLTSPAFIDSKADISNYLESSNIDGDTNYQVIRNGAFFGQTGTFNDIAYCIRADMQVRMCPDL